RQTETPGQHTRTAGASPLHVMTSSGGVVTAGQVIGQPISTVLSGPAAGAVGAAMIARNAGISRVLTCDGGGTPTDVAVVGGAGADDRGVRGGGSGKDPNGGGGRGGGGRGVDCLGVAWGGAKRGAGVRGGRPGADLLGEGRSGRPRPRCALGPRPHPATLAR